MTVLSQLVKNGRNQEVMERHLVSLLYSSLPVTQLRQIHAVILRSHPGLLQLFLELLPCPSTISYARQLFDVMPHPDPFLCNSIISTYSRLSMHGDVLRAFFSAHLKGTQVTFLSFPAALKSCVPLMARNEGKQIHSFAVACGFHSNAYIQTGLIDFYSKIGDLGSARKVLDEVSAMDPVPYSSMICGYSMAGDVLNARKLFEEMTHRTLSSWNSIISCYAHVGDPMKGLALFRRMLDEDVKPNEVTVVNLLSLCTKLGDLEKGLWIKKMIDDLDLCTNLIVRTAIMEMYVKCGAVDEARREFDRMESRDVVAWSAMIAGYAQNGRPNEALELFERMRQEGLRPNEVTLVSVLSACAQLGSVEVGNQIGAYVESQRLALGIYVGSALIDMYSKCGNIGKAWWVFRNMNQRDIVSWNAMIGGLAFNGLARDAIELFREIARSGFKPDDITFVGVLSACVHAGLVDLGLEFFEIMKRDHCIAPKVEHCACIVDLYCKSGRLPDAYKFICKMRVEPNVVIWGTLLSACRCQLNFELAEHAVKKLLVLEPKNSGNYVLLSSMYIEAGRWEEARKTRLLMGKNDVKKLSGYSSIHLDGAEHRFLVGDAAHQKSDEIADVVVGLGSQLKCANNDPQLELEFFSEVL